MGVIIVMDKIESGCCRVGDRCLLMLNRTRVEVTNIYYEEMRLSHVFVEKMFDWN
jgi:hypothetical protein